MMQTSHPHHLNFHAKAHSQSVSVRKTPEVSSAQIYLFTNAAMNMDAAWNHTAKCWHQKSQLLSVQRTMFHIIHDKLASKCNLFTNEKYGYASFSKLMKARGLQDVFDYYERIGAAQEFREMLVIDSLCFNQDRHAGNHGVLFDNDTLEIIGMAPVFDLNLSLLPYVSMDDFNNIGDKLYEYAPILGDDFTRLGQIAMNNIIRDRVKDMKDFSFSFRGDDTFSPERVKALESIVRKQAEAILSSEVLHTNDVFFSKTAIEDEKYQEEVNKAVKRFNVFRDAVENMNLDDNIFISECVSSNAVQYILEMNSYELTVDFIKKRNQNSR